MLNYWCIPGSCLLLQRMFSDQSNGLLSQQESAVLSYREQELPLLLLPRKLHLQNTGWNIVSLLQPLLHSDQHLRNKNILRYLTLFPLKVSDLWSCLKRKGIGLTITNSYLKLVQICQISFWCSYQFHIQHPQLF